MRFSVLATAAVAVVAPALGLSQDPMMNSSPVAAVSDSNTQPSPAIDNNLMATPVWQSTLNRWVELRDMDFSLRYRSVFDSNNAHEYNQGQQRGIIDGKFKFDKKGRYGIVFHASTGKYFNWAYADFIGGGTQKGFGLEYTKATPIQQAAVDAYLTPERIAVEGASGGWAFYIRRLYADIEPIDGLEFQYGSLDINRGAASEITTYDNDGYISGGRILIKQPKRLFFDEMSVTYAYFGDLYTPNFFARGDRLEQSNYHQFLIRKRIGPGGKRVNTSFDYTFQDKSNTFRQAAEVDVHESRVLDSVRVETYERANAISFKQVVDFAPGGKGYAFTLTKKKVTHRLSVDGGFAHIDPHQGVLTQSETSATFCMGVNGDSYGLGSRWFVRPSIRLTPYLAVMGFYTHQVGGFSVHDQIVWNKEALNAGFDFNMKKLFFPKHE